MSLCVTVYCYVVCQAHYFCCVRGFGTCMYLLCCQFGTELKCACLLHSALLHLTSPPLHTLNTERCLSYHETSQKSVFPRNCLWSPNGLAYKLPLYGKMELSQTHICFALGRPQDSSESPPEPVHFFYGSTESANG